MRIRLTFDFDDDERRAIAAKLGCRRPATRTQIVQQVSGLIAGYKARTLAEFPGRPGAADPAQLKFEAFEASALDPDRRMVCCE